MTVLVSPRFSIAPMMKYTDRHCRYFHRLLSRRAVLFTEMVSTGALIYGEAARQLSYHAAEHPLVLQLGGSNPESLGKATAIAVPFGFDEINLNIGCPSDSAKDGCFGAALMKTPDLVMRCIDHMRAQSPVDVTVKCRIGIDDQVPEAVLPDFLTRLQSEGISRVYIHARKAWLKGLSPKENRTIPPLDYSLVARMRTLFTGLEIILNGGLETLDQAKQWLKQVDGVMMGRAAYHTPDFLTKVDRDIFGEDRTPNIREVLAQYAEYTELEQPKGVTTAALIKPLLGLYHKRLGARKFRRHLTLGAAQKVPAHKLIRQVETFMPPFKA